MALGLNLAAGGSRPVSPREPNLAINEGNVVAHVESKTEVPHVYEVPSRVRGELFNQPPRTTYIFGTDTLPIPLSLLAFKAQRLIVVEVEAAKIEIVTAEWPALSNLKKKFAIQLLEQLSSQYVGRWAEIIRWLRREKPAFRVEGPFIPHQQGSALVTLMIRVSRDTNFDESYQIAKRYFELHPDNEDLLRFQKQWEKPKAKPSNSRDSYDWTEQELWAIESMAPLEPDAQTFGTERTEEERLRFNEIVWRQCQQRLNQLARGIVEEGNEEASGVAESILRGFFNRK